MAIAPEAIFAHSPPPHQVLIRGLFRINAGIFSPDGPPAQISRIRVSKDLAYGINASTIIGRGTALRETGAVTGKTRE